MRVKLHNTITDSIDIDLLLKNTCASKDTLMDLNLQGEVYELELVQTSQGLLCVTNRYQVKVISDCPFLCKYENSEKISNFKHLFK